MHKKSQIANVLTWFVAFVIIIFIMFLFTGMTLTMAGKKQLTLFGWVNLKETSADLFEQSVLQRDIIGILNAPITDDLKVIDVLIEPNLVGGEDKAKELVSKTFNYEDCVSYGFETPIGIFYQYYDGTKLYGKGVYEDKSKAWYFYLEGEKNILGRSSINTAEINFNYEGEDFNFKLVYKSEC